MPRRTTDTKKKKFLDAQERALSVGDSARHAGVSRGTPYQWENDDEKFNQAWAKVREIRLEMLDDTAMDQALEGDGFMLRFLINRYDRQKANQAVETIGEIMIIPAGEPTSEDGPHEFVTLEYGEVDEANDEDPT